jgi:hypothetical protein
MSCQTHFITILGLIELRGLLSKGGEDSFGEITGLKPGKERMLGKARTLLSLTLVFFQRNVENGGKVGMRGIRGRDRDMVWLPGPPLPVKRKRETWRYR